MQRQPSMKVNLSPPMEAVEGEPKTLTKKQLDETRAAAEMASFDTDKPPSVTVTVAQPEEEQPEKDGILQTPRAPGMTLKAKGGK